MSAGKWTGSGYIILDPVTGLGSYIISGGTNGDDTEADEDFAISAAMMSIKPSIKTSYEVGASGGFISAYIFASLSVIIPHVSKLFSNNEKCTKLDKFIGLLIVAGEIATAFTAFLAARVDNVQVFLISIIGQFVANLSADRKLANC